MMAVADTTLPLTEAHVGARCAWCDEYAGVLRLVRHPRMGKIKGNTVVIEPPEYRPVCGKCNNHLPLPLDPATEKKREAGRAGSWKKKQEKLF